jgi:phosphate starvation-inducible PhoH-like protein
MFLTRLGMGSKMVISGDTTQIDLPPNRTSGLVDAMRRLHQVPGCCRVRLGGGDIVRHPLVQRIVEAYDDEATLDRPRASR